MPSLREIESRVAILERDFGDLRKTRRDDSEKIDQLIKDVATLGGKVAGYLVAGMVLAAGLSISLSTLMKG